MKCHAPIYNLLNELHTADMILLLKYCAYTAKLCQLYDSVHLRRSIFGESERHFARVSFKLYCLFWLFWAFSEQC